MARDVREWLEGLKLGQYAQAFVENDVDHALLPELSENDLEKLGVASLGHRKRLVKAIALLRADIASERSVAAAALTPIPPGAGAEAERRQLSVMFCDLVGSTPLSERLDPEDLRDVIRAYQDAVARAAKHYGGHIARYLGDGLLVYFGWPRAHEDQAERAIRAGLAAIAAVRNTQLEGDLQLNARVGIATGRVVIGDLVGDVGRDVDAVTGETPNLAARLQGVARSNQVVIDAATYGLVGTAFELEDMGVRDLKGFSQPVPVWNVRGEGKAESRFDAAHEGRLARFVGREHELGLVRERWELAKRAEGQAVFLTGEAGIGKSRLIQALREEIGDDRYFYLRYQCSPYHTNTAFYPVIQRLERAAGFTGEDDPDTRLDKLDALVRRISADDDPDVADFAALLSLPAELRYGARELSPQQQRDRTIEALIGQLVDLSRLRPVLFLLEDAHWIDPTTEALIGEAMTRIDDVPALMVITSRPEYLPPWTNLPNLTTITLNRLSRAQCAEIARDIGRDRLTDNMIAQIVARTDGVPLFVEELAKSLLDSDEDQAEIPASLQALLTARLDRLGSAGKLAPLAATLGRSFHYRLIRAACTLDNRELDATLTAMTEAGLLFLRGTPPQATYTFKHALIQDAAYKTLLRSKRQQYHRNVAEVLQRDFREQAATEPELVARHLSLAGLTEKAVAFWLLAGQRAGERSAHVEAIANLRNGLRELELLPKSSLRDEREFDLRIALGASLLAVKGWSAPDVEENYELAQELSASTGDIRKLFTALRGLFNVFLLKGQIGNACRLADRLLSIAQQQGDKALLLEGYRTVGMCGFFVGDFVAAHENLQRANAIYDRSLHHAHAFVYGTDPAVVGLSVGGWVEWFLGNPEAARNSADAAVRLAEEVKHPFSLAYARSLAASVYQVCRLPDVAREHAEAAIIIAEEHDYPYWRGWATVMQGWALAALGEPDRGIDFLRRGLDIYESTGARQIRPYILTLLAEMYGWAGAPREGIDVLVEALDAGSRSDVCFYEAEAARIQGELLRQSRAGDGQTQFETALNLSRRQYARGLELRAALSAARASIARGDRAAAEALVSAIYRTFDAHLTDPDLADARAILGA